MVVCTLQSDFIYIFFFWGGWCLRFEGCQVVGEAMIVAVLFHLCFPYIYICENLLTIFIFW